MTNADHSMLDHLDERVAAVAGFNAIARDVIDLGEMLWSDAMEDLRRLAINYVLRRQLESLDAAVALHDQHLAHLSVQFVRPALEEFLYLKYLMTLPVEDSQELFKALGVWDSVRSLLAQRDFIGDEDMRGLWYSTSFLDAAEAKRTMTKAELARIKKKHRWDGREAPNTAWIAKQVDEVDLYNYLFAATSRAIHFSAGEVMRRGWGSPDGILVTDKPEFRSHLAAFALDELARLFVHTWVETAPLHDLAGIGNIEGFEFSAGMGPALTEVTSFGRVPLVHAHEFNLTPTGPMRFREDSSSAASQPKSP
ncbi:DUF5677 domain-containing protein [Nocardioides sp.]|uniref:DUF5677 domain-containing protein n=1 Tax=Nocardioides sp. TaxID=35761 RepID=UPI003D0ED5CD